RLVKQPSAEHWRDRESERDEGIGARQRDKGQNPNPADGERAVERKGDEKVGVSQQTRQLFAYLRACRKALRRRFEYHLSASHADRIGSQQYDLRQRETII